MGKLSALAGGLRNDKTRSQRSKVSRTRKFYLWSKLMSLELLYFLGAAGQCLASLLLFKGRSLVYFPTDDVGHAKRA